VRREQNAARAIFDKLTEQCRQVVARYRIKPAGRFVEDQKPRMMGQGKGQHAFHPHSGGKLPDLLVRVDRKCPEIPPVRGLVPRIIEPSRDIGDRPHFLVSVEIDFAEHDPDMLLASPFVDEKRQPEHFDAPAFRSDKIEQGFQRCRLPCSVRTDEPHDPPFAHSETDIPQRERRVRFRQSGDFQDIHVCSSCASTPWASCPAT
jgi:hypothetical protein